MDVKLSNCLEKNLVFVPSDSIYLGIYTVDANKRLQNKKSKQSLWSFVLGPYWPPPLVFMVLTRTLGQGFWVPCEIELSSGNNG